VVTPADYALEFEQSQISHLLWRIQFSYFLTGNPAEKEFSPDYFFLEPWFGEQAPGQITGEPSYLAAQNLFLQLKKLVSDLVRLKETGDSDKLDEKLIAFYSLSDELLSHLGQAFSGAREVLTPGKELLVWDSDWDIGVPELDGQHQSLVSVINDLNQAILAGKDGEVLQDILRRLEDYTRLHFTTEEIYMKSVRFPGFDQHRERHQDFINWLVRFRTDIQSHQLNPQDLLSFLFGWLIFHIRKSDREIGELISASEGLTAGG